MTTPSDPGRTNGPSEPDPRTQPLGYWQQQAGYPPPGSPPTMGYPSTPGAPGQPFGVPDHPRATTALVLGLVALVGGLVCLVPFVVGPWAWAIGRRTVRQIDAEPYRFGGRGVAMAGYVLGVIATILLVLGLIAIVGLFVLLVSYGSGTFAESGTVRL